MKPEAAVAPAAGDSVQVTHTGEGREESATDLSADGASKTEFGSGLGRPGRRRYRCK